MMLRSSRLMVASTRVRVSQGGRGSLPEKYMLYSPSSFRRSLSRTCNSRSSALASATLKLPRNQEPHERQPQLARVRNGTIINQHFARIERAHQLEEVAQLRRIGRPEARTVTE